MTLFHVKVSGISFMVGFPQIPVSDHPVPTQLLTSASLLQNQTRNSILPPRLSPIEMSSTGASNFPKEITALRGHRDHLYKFVRYRQRGTEHLRFIA